jgi:hypothetical protein
MFRVTTRTRFLRSLRSQQEKPADKLRAAEREEIRKIIESRSADFSAAHSTFTAFKKQIAKWLFILALGGFTWAVTGSVEYRKDEVEDKRRLAVRDKVIYGH